MKKLFLLTLFVVLVLRSNAQSTFTLVSNPCDTNKVLAISFTTTSPPPYIVSWPYNSTFSGTTWTSDTISSTTDTLFHYDGAAITVYVSSGPAVVAYGSYGPVPSSFSFTFLPTPAFCGAAGNAAVSVSGGTPPFSYYWANASTPSTVAGTTNPALLPSGIYGITIVDGAGCITGSREQTVSMPSVASTPYEDTLHATTTYSVTTTSTNANCTNGTAAVTGTSGSGAPPYSYLWSNGATSSSISGLIAGSYSVMLTDALGCVGHGYATVTQLTTITVHTTPSPATCLANDGSIIGFGSGGLPPYSYLWSNGATTRSQSGLIAGSLTLTVTDANGCIGTGTGRILASTPITVTYSSTASLCTSPTGTATITIAGGTPPYTDTFYTSPLQTSLTATNLAPGTYSFHVVDAVGCIRDGAVVVPPIDVLNLAFTPTPALCTLSNGSINLSVTGGVGPYTYSWNTGATTPNISGASSANYTVTVTDNNSCVKAKTVYVPSTSPLSVGFSSTPASCIFVNDGTASAIVYGGTSPYTYHWSNGGSGSTIVTLFTGDYWAYVIDANGCINNNYYWDHVGYNASDSTCFCIINGTVYYDANGNCVQDAGETGIPNIQVYCSGIGYAYTDASGAYSFIVHAGSYTISESVLSYYPLSACQANNILVTTSVGAGCTHTVDFANTINPIHDVHVSTWNDGAPVPGNTYTQSCIITNNGTVTESNILSGYNTDGQIFGASFIPSGIFNAGTTNWYTTAGGALSLAPRTSQRFYINYSVPTYIPINTNLVFKDSVAYTAPMNNWLTDYSPWDNVNYFMTQVVASYDPNFMEVSPKGTGANGNITYKDSVLEYMVHFQNTGTYQAQNIVVTDTLDPNLDWTTLQPVYESAPCKVTLNNNGAVKFTFNNINLPDSATNPITSNGMFTYTIHIKPNLPLGTQIKAHSSIYFDYNAPVVTNTTLNTIDSVLSVGVTNVSAGSSYSSFTIYPNPTSQSFSAIINTDEGGPANMDISDISGKILMSKTIALQKGMQTNTTDVNQLAAGVYFVTINQQGKVQTQKLVIMK